MYTFVYVPSELAEEMRRVMKDAGIDSLSRVIHEGSELYAAEYDWELGKMSLGV